MRKILPVGMRLGLFEIVSGLYAGRDAFVYKARNCESGEIRALKVLPNDAPAFEINSFAWEAEVSSILGKHPNLGRVYEANHTQDLHYLVMDVVDGSNVENIMCSGEIPVDTSLKIARDVAHGLEHMHKHKIVHRDVKTPNIMFDNNKATLIDFGIAYHTERKIRKAPEFCILGSPCFLPPEYWLGIEPNFFGDIYSLGTCLFLMISGITPVEHVFPVDIIDYAKWAKQVSGESLMPHLRELVPDIPVVVDDVCARALDRVERRYSSAQEFADALDDALRKL